MYWWREKKKGPSIEPWVTPQQTSAENDRECSVG